MRGTRYTTEVIATEVKFFDAKREDAEESGPPPEARPKLFPGTPEEVWFIT